MAAAAELSSIVAAYLRKHGFSKTLAAFFRENGDTSEEEDIVDLETLYKLHISTQVNGNTRTKKSKKTKLEDTLEMAKGNEDIRDNAEEKVNGGASSERKKKKKGEKENLIDSPMVAKTEAKNIPKEGVSKKKRNKEKPEEANETIEGLKPKVENCLPVAGTLKPSVEEALSCGHAGHDSALNKIVVGTCVDNGGGLAIQQEVAQPPKSLNKRSKKEKKEQGGEQLAGSEILISIETRLADNTQVSSQQDGLAKKKRKKSKDGGAGEEETKDANTAEPACKTPINGQTEMLDAMKQPVESFGEPGGCGTSSKKKKKRKELLLEGAGDVNGSIQEPSDAKLETTKNEEELIDSKKGSGKKRKHKEDTSPVNGILNHDHNSSVTSPEKTKEAGGGEVVHDCNVEKHESGSTKTKKHKETPTNKKTPTGALAFQRVEVDKVSFSDPRLSDNSYWGKDGAEEGYGARAQEVLGLVRGRDFRHEKTKKKRGSYRGGLIGLESHSIKFENSDED